MSPDNQPPNNFPSGPEALPEERVEERRSRQADIWRGVGLALLMHLIQIPLAVVTAFVSLIFVGVSQLAYIIPASIFYHRAGRRGVVKGLIIVAAITFLLNATCTVIIFTALNNIH
jgi:hypothetical protein